MTDTPNITPPPADSAWLEAGHALFTEPCDFVSGAVSLETIPPSKLPEVAFAGRSNVGKSSLLNALTNRRTLAKTSGTPGRTRQLNFFTLASSLMMVDMPGYGYAKAPKHEVEGWNKLILQYLRGRPQLRRVCLLIDARHGIKPNDTEIMRLLDEVAVPYQLVLTKADKLNVYEQRTVLEATQAALRKHPAAHPHIVLTSAETRDGMDVLRANLAELTTE